MNKILRYLIFTSILTVCLTLTTDLAAQSNIDGKAVLRATYNNTPGYFVPDDAFISLRNTILSLRDRNNLLETKTKLQEQKILELEGVQIPALVQQRDIWSNASKMHMATIEGQNLELKRKGREIKTLNLKVAFFKKLGTIGIPVAIAAGALTVILIK